MLSISILIRIFIVRQFEFTPIPAWRNYDSVHFEGSENIRAVF